MRLSEMFMRAIGPILFTIGFAIYMARYSTMNEYLDLVKARFLNNTVYEQSSISSDSEIFDFSPDGDYTVTGSYVAGFICSEITERTVVVGDRNDYYQKVVIDPTYVSDKVLYTAYKGTLSPTAIGNLTPVRTDEWKPGETIDIRYVLDYYADYSVAMNYTTTGEVESIVFEKIP